MPPPDITDFFLGILNDILEQEVCSPHLTEAFILRGRYRSDKDHKLSMKNRFMCSSCDRTWTSARGVVHVKYHYFAQHQAVELNAITFRQACKACGAWGLMKPYDSEIERMARLTLEVLLLEIGV